MGIKIIRAVYGTSSKGNDVTAICQQLASSGSILVNNESMGGDPDYGVRKKFDIVYTLPSGELRVKACWEGETIDFNS